MTTRRDHIKASDVFTEPLTIAEILESHRECEEMKPSELAEALGMKRQQYNNIVSGKDCVSVSKAVKFAEILGQSEEVFVKVALNDLLKRNALSYTVKTLEVGNG